MLTRRPLLRPELCVVALAVVVRLVPVLLVPRLHSPLTYEYEWIADRILAGEGFRFPHLGLDYLSMRPVFVYLCVAVYWLTGHSHAAMLAVQALVSGVTALVAYTLAKQLGGERAAVVAGIATAIEPALVYYDITRIHPVGLHTLLLSLVVLAFVHAAQSPRPRLLLTAGVAVGVAFLERGTPIVFAVVALSLIGYWRRYTALQALRTVALVSAGVVVVVSPWAFRNYGVYGTPVVAMTAGPELLWIGNNPNTTGTTMTEAGQTMLEAAPAHFRAQVLAADELTQQRLFLERFRAFVLENPTRAAALYLKKLRTFWWFGTQEGREHPGWALMVYRPLYGVWLLTATWGFVVGLRSSNARSFVLLLAFLAAVSMAQSLAFVEGRHRVVVVPMLLVAGACAVVRIAARLDRRAWARAQELARDPRT